MSSNTPLLAALDHLLGVPAVESTVELDKRLKEWKNSTCTTILPTVHINDKFPVNIIDPNLNCGPWIAGGAALSWYQGEPIGFSDIDVFFNSKGQFDRVNNIVKTLNATILHESANAITYGLTVPSSSENTMSNWKIQLIKRTFDNVQQLVDSFDITVCQIATDGRSYVLGNNTAQHIKTKTLAMINMTPSLIRRVIKYWSYGYEPTTELLDYISNNSDAITWTLPSSDDYDTI